MRFLYLVLLTCMFSLLISELINEGGSTWCVRRVDVVGGVQMPFG